MSKGMIFVMAGLTAACGEQQPAPQPERPNAFHERLLALAPPARNLGLRNAIIDSGVRCERVDRSAFQQHYKGTAMWLAHCVNKGEFAVFVGPAGYGEVVRCDILRGTGAPPCTWPEAALDGG